MSAKGCFKQLPFVKVLPNLCTLYRSGINLLNHAWNHLVKGKKRLKLFQLAVFDLKHPIFKHFKPIFIDLQNFFRHYYHDYTAKM